MKKAFTHIILVLTLAVLAAGCTRRQLETRPDDGILIINLQWGGISGRPAGTQYTLYNTTTGETLRRQGDANGYVGHVPAGIYEIIAINTGLNNIILSDGTGYLSDNVTADQDILWAPAGYIKSISNAFSSSIANVEVSKTHIPTVVGMPMHNLTRKLSVTVETNGYPNIDNLYVSVDGIVTGRDLHDRSLHNDMAQVTSEVVKHPILPDRYEGSISFFGVKPGGTNLIDATLVYNGVSETSDQIDITTDLADPNDTDVTISITLTFTTVTIDVTVTVHGWDESGTGSGDVG